VEKVVFKFVTVICYRSFTDLFVCLFVFKITQKIFYWSGSSFQMMGFQSIWKQIKYLCFSVYIWMVISLTCYYSNNQILQCRSNQGQVRYSSSSGFQPLMPPLGSSTVVCLQQCHSVSFLSSGCFSTLWKAKCGKSNRLFVILSFYVIRIFLLSQRFLQVYMHQADYSCVFFWWESATHFHMWILEQHSC